MQALVSAMLERNAIAHDDLVSIVFTATDDISSMFPATAAALPSGWAMSRSSAPASWLYRAPWPDASGS